MDPNNEDPQYLKNYIKEHPTNKMAWYLLGRQYAAKGEEGKANYCFAQAGEVYRAFENSAAFTNPLEDEEPAEETADRTEQTVTGRPARWRKIAVVLLLLLLGSHIPFQDDRFERSAAEAAAGDRLGQDAQNPAVETGGNAESAAGGKFGVVYTRPGGGSGSGSSRTNQIADMLNRLYSRSQEKAESLLLADPTWSGDGRWLLWTARTKPIVTAQRPDHAAPDAKLTYYDAAACQCEPADAAAPSAQYVKWQNDELQKLIVRSSAAAYEQQNGKPPEQIEQMAQNYPDNLMTGYTAAMKREFEVWLAERKNGQSAASGGEPHPGQPSGTAPAAANPGNGELLPASEALKEPLRIMVDITTHRLAVVSGNVLLRSYPVGLGGDRTPEGEFQISEKVRNPNGRDNGTFGSRGMTLSDTLYAIHGTNQPSSIGQDKSLGCIRMLKPDVEELFDMVPIGTKVTIGRDLPLPDETLRAVEPLKLPSVSDETNPNKVYKWLD